MNLDFALSDFLQISVLTCTAIWAVFKIRISVNKVDLTLQSLAMEVRKLDKTLEHLQSKIDNHNERIVRVETRMNIQDTGRIGPLRPPP